MVREKTLEGMAFIMNKSGKSMTLRGDSFELSISTQGYENFDAGDKVRVKYKIREDGSKQFIDLRGQDPSLKYPFG